MRCISALPVVRHLLLGSGLGSLRCLGFPAPTKALVLSLAKPCKSNKHPSQVPISWVLARHLKPSWRHLLTLWLDPENVRTGKESVLFLLQIGVDET